MIRVEHLIRTFDQITLGRSVRWVEIVLVVLLAIALARLMIDLIPSVPTGNSAANSGLIAPTEQDNRKNPGIQTNTETISPTLKQLFGGSNASAVSKEVEEEPVQQTSLNLVLKGILADRDSDNRVALIAVGGSKEQVYRVADQIEGTEIIRIEARRVIIRRNGMMESVELEVKKLSGSTNASAAPNRISFGTGIRKIGDNELVILRSTLQQHMNNLPALLQQATAEPYSQDGEQIGFRMVGIQQGSVFQQLGLQQGDIIYSVNGTSIRNVEAALNAYRNMGSASAFRVGVMRGGQDISLNISVK